MMVAFKLAGRMKYDGCYGVAMKSMKSYICLSNWRNMLSNYLVKINKNAKSKGKNEDPLVGWIMNNISN